MVKHCGMEIWSFHVEGDGFLLKRIMNIYCPNCGKDTRIP